MQAGCVHLGKEAPPCGGVAPLPYQGDCKADCIILLSYVTGCGSTAWPSRHGTRYFSPLMDKRAITTISRHSPRETRVISPP